MGRSRIPHMHRSAKRRCVIVLPENYQTTSIRIQFPPALLLRSPSPLSLCHYRPNHPHLPPSASPVHRLPEHLLRSKSPLRFLPPPISTRISCRSPTLLIATMASLFSYQHAYVHNSTMLSSITPTTLHAPFYHTTRPNLLSFMSDKYLSLAAPVLAYWLYSFFFHFLDTVQFSYFEKRRIHDSPEVLARNKVTVTQVIKAVILQHVIQTVLGIFWLEDDEVIFRREVMKDHLAAMGNLAPWVADGVLLVLGRRIGEQVLKSNGEAIVRWVYWWGVPALQMLFAL